MTRVGRILTAIVAGNLIYFGLGPYLPSGARHRTWDLDLGLLVDGIICLLVYGALGIIFRGRMP